MSHRLIDLIFTNNVDNIQSQGTLPPIADHEGIFVNFPRIQVKDSLIKKSVFDFKRIDEIGLRNFIKNFDFEKNVFCKPVLQQAEAMTTILDAAQRKFVPTKTITINPRDQPWVNSYTRLLMRKKNRNYRIFKKVSSELFSVINKHGVSEDIVTRLKDKKIMHQNVLGVLQMNPLKLILGLKMLFLTQLMPQCRIMKFQPKKSFLYLLN